MKKNKFTFNFLDKITLKRLKYIIIISGILSLICEFAPSILNICEILGYCKLAVFMQPHKEFFTNLALGCLASAFISYYILYVSIKTKEDDRKEKLISLSKKVITEYLKLNSYIKSGEISNETEHNMKEMNLKLDLFLDEFLNCYNESDIVDQKIVEMKSLFTDRIIPLGIVEK